MHRSTVDFPEPDGPMMIVTVPVLIRRLASRTARMDPKDLDRWSTTIRSSAPKVGRSDTSEPPLQVLDQEGQDKEGLVETEGPPRVQPRRLRQVTDAEQRRQG